MSETFLKNSDLTLGYNNYLHAAKRGLQPASVHSNFQDILKNELSKIQKIHGEGAFASGAFMAYKDLLYVYNKQGIAGLINWDKKEYAALPKIPPKKDSQVKGNIFFDFIKMLKSNNIPFTTSAIKNFLGTTKEAAKAVIDFVNTGKISAALSSGIPINNLQVLNAINGKQNGLTGILKMYKSVGGIASKSISYACIAYNIADAVYAVKSPGLTDEQKNIKIATSAVKIGLSVGGTIIGGPSGAALRVGVFVADAYFADPKNGMGGIERALTAADNFIWNKHSPTNVALQLQKANTTGHRR